MRIQLLTTPDEAAKRVPGADSGHIGRRGLQSGVQHDVAEA
jgi:hypothetical protein